MDWPIFYGNELKVGNPESPVGVCTLWTKRDVIYKNLPEGKFAVCGNLYTVQGINPMLKNILANPKIRYIVLCGADLMKSGEALLNFLRNGIDESRKIIGSSGYIDSNVDVELVKKFRESVKVIDLRGREGDVPAVVDSIKEEARPFMEPVWITELDKSVASLKTEDVVFKVRGPSIPWVWLRALNNVMKFGEEKDTDYKIRQKEILDLVSVIDGDESTLPAWLPITEMDLENYYETFFSKERPLGVEYTYGERLFSYSLSHVPDKFLEEFGGAQDQIAGIVKILKERPHTRRAVAFTLKEEDSGSKNPPCLTQIVWSIRAGKLVQTANFRSHDVFVAWLLNAFALRRLQKQIAERVGIGLGKLVILSNSAHVYENNWKEAEKMLEKNFAGRVLPLVEDEHGYFIVKVEQEIVVEHYTKGGLPSGFVFHGKDAQILYRKILHEGLVSLMDHAAYLGHQLAKAEYCLKEGERFVQDKA